MLNKSMFAITGKSMSAGVMLAVALVVLGIACGGSSAALPPGSSPIATQGSESESRVGIVIQDQSAALPTPSATKTIMVDANRKVGGAVGDLAPEFSGIAAWINSEPLTMEALRGSVVLIDFWTYTCINCIHTFPFLREMQSKYADEGLVIVGVHSPEFEFEKDYENVVAAIQKNELVWPMAQDNDFKTWYRYNNRYWPAEYLIDKDGVIRYTHFGEGAYAETEVVIQELLAEIGS